MTRPMHVVRTGVVPEMSSDQARGASVSSAWRTSCGLVAPLFLGGCGLSGAPSFSLFGAFFPSWLLCAVLGVICAFLARIVFVASGLAHILPFQLLVCTSIGVLCGALIWLLFFG